MKKLLFWIWQWTWGLPQTLVGLIVFSGLSQVSPRNLSWLHYHPLE